MYKN
jgi:ATP-binding cassette subfamily A (ABC1) protein 3